MKKILTNLTVIVFLIALPVAVGCGNTTKQSDSEKEENGSEQEANESTMVEVDSTTVIVYLSEIWIGESMHLLMSEERKPDFYVIDGLLTDVKRGDTVIFMKGQNSRIDEVLDVSLVEKTFKIIREDAEDREEVYYKIIIGPNAPIDSIVKYVIEFTVKQDPTKYIIDPYLKIKGEGLN